MDAYLDAGELAELEDDMAAALVSSCTLHDKVLTDSGDGGYDVAVGPTLATYACRRGKGRTTQKILRGLPLDVMRWPLFLAAGAVVSMTQLIQLGGQTFEIVETLDNDFQVNPKIWIERV